MPPPFPFDPDEHCCKYFTFRDFFECSETWKKTTISNLPSDPRTWSAIQDLGRTILDPVWEAFGELHLTYGFCSSSLANRIKKNKRPRIAPDRDQHAGYECNNHGNRICKRGGAACDFIVANSDMRIVLDWITGNCHFDRIYYYGKDRPIHVSLGEDCSREIYWLKEKNGRLHPVRISEHDVSFKLKT